MHFEAAAYLARVDKCLLVACRLHQIDLEPNGNMLQEQKGKKNINLSLNTTEK